MILSFYSSHLLKVSLSAYLFLFISQSAFSSKANTPLFSNEQQTAYELILSLKFQKALPLIQDNSSASIYLTSLAESLQLVISENAMEYKKYDDAHSTRLSQIKSLNKPKNAINGFFIAEMNIHSAFVDLKFGHEFKAAWQIKRAYKLISENQKKHPELLYNNKTLGLLHVMIGSVPQKYQWIVSLFGMNGSISSGLKELEAISSVHNNFQTESLIIQSLIYSYLLGKPEKGIEVFGDTYSSNTQNEFLGYLNILLMMKNQQSKQAELVLENFKTGEFEISLMNYVGGEIYLQKGDFKESRKWYERFLKTYKGRSNIKDAHYKIFLCSYLQGSDEALELRKTAINAGEDVTEADKYASKILKQEENPHPLTLKIRLLTDGGFYDNAEKLLIQNKEVTFANQKNEAEFEYRKARLAHSQHQNDKAILTYKKTITLSQDNAWYFAPNSCLLLGNLYEQQGVPAKAREYYKMVFRYDDYEYQRSIENKAKRALEALDR